MMVARSRRRAFRIVWYLAILLVGVPVLVEALVRSYVALRGVRLPLDYTFPLMLEPDPEIGRRLRPSVVWTFDGHEYRHNSLGTLGPEFEPDKPPDRLRLFTLGGSTSYFEDYPRKLEEVLNRAPRRGDKSVEAINLAVPGYTARASHLRLLRYLKYQPDLVLYYEAINDVQYGPADEPGAVLRPDWESRSSWLNKTYLVFFGRRVLKSLFQDTGPPHDPLTPEVRAQKNLERFETFLERILDECQARGVPVVLSTFLYVKKSPSDERFARAVAGSNEVIRQLAQRENVHLVDTARLIPAESELFRGHFADTHHFDGWFAERLAEHVGGFIEEKIGPFQPEPP